MKKDTFTNGLPRICSEEEFNSNWGVGLDKSLKCSLCEKKIKIGDYWRWQYLGDIGAPNIILCSDCDSEDIKEKYSEMKKEFLSNKWKHFRKFYGVRDEY